MNGPDTGAISAPLRYHHFTHYSQPYMVRNRSPNSFVTEYEYVSGTAELQLHNISNGLFL